jgi:hypothetical protein
MQEHKRKKGKYLLTEAKLGGDVRHRVTDRDQAIDDKEQVQVFALGQFDQINHYIDRDDGGIDNRVTSGLNGVADRKHRIRILKLNVIKSTIHDSSDMQDNPFTCFCIVPFVPEDFRAFLKFTSFFPV